ncbi:unnamed protein product [Oikopleura dioica]|uniref:Uncharacterized protein n=1 Tax=Oikopleura dioica TaxID=34765 RepID=E4X9U8_OIKDI|nr:unnamed protein product [Oikopleura dioica]
MQSVTNSGPTCSSHCLCRECSSRMNLPQCNRFSAERVGTCSSCCSVGRRRITAEPGYFSVIGQSAFALAARGRRRQEAGRSPRNDERAGRRSYAIIRFHFGVEQETARLAKESVLQNWLTVGIFQESFSNK